jgi:hypothetical protein
VLRCRDDDSTKKIDPRSKRLELKQEEAAHLLTKTVLEQSESDRIHKDLDREEEELSVQDKTRSAQVRVYASGKFNVPKGELFVLLIFSSVLRYCARLV